MSGLRRRFSDDLRSAVNGGDSCRAATLRLILATLDDRDGAARDAGEEEGLGDAAILDMLAWMVRQRRDSAAVYRARGRRDLAAREAEEIGCIEAYLPPPLDESETDRAIAEAIAESGAGSLKDMGRAMAALKARYAGRMDFSAASRAVRTRLASRA